jgi:very-short-patch-repair endonuclease
MRNAEPLKTASREYSLPEKLLWKRLKPSVSFQFNIRRQHRFLDEYMVDYYCPEYQVAFEIFGEEKEAIDPEVAEKRYRAIEELGVTFIRLPLGWILRSPNQVSDFILDICRGERTVDELDEFYR